MQVGAYTVTRELGRGGMGVVYEARHPDWPDAPLALKLIRKEVADAAATARFQREAEVLARIEHPSVVRVRTLGMFDEQLFLVTDLVQGVALSERLRLGALPPEEAVAVVRALCSALAAVHAEGVLHRDLKPANVIVRPDGTPVLLDFGVALDQGAEKLTQTGAMIGTPSYMSPEQAAGERGRMGPHSDIYALGAILFALLSGRAPFEAESSMVVVKRILTEEPRWPSSDDARVPASLEAVLRKAMAKEPHQRYRTASALSEDLARWERGEDPLAFETFQTEQERRRRPAAIAAGAVVLAVAVGAALTRSTSPAPEPTGSGSLRPRPRRAAPALDPAAELRRLRGVGGPRKVELARAFLTAFPDHEQASQVRTELLQAGLTAPTRVGEVTGAGQPWGRFLGADRLVFVPRVHSGGARPVMLWDLSAPRGRESGPALEAAERRDMEAVTHQGALALGLSGSGLLRFDPALATRGPDRSGRDAPVRKLTARGPWLAAGFADGAVLLWKGPELQPGPAIAGHADLPPGHRSVHGLGFSADGARLWTCSGNDRSVVRVWSTVDGVKQHERAIALDEVHVVVPHPREPATMLLGTHDTNKLYLLDAADGEQRLFEGRDLRAMSARGAHSSHLRDAAFSPDGTRIYSVSGVNGVARTSELRVWDARTRKELTSPIRRRGLVLFGLALSADGAQLVTLGQKAGQSVSVLELWQVDRPERSP